MAAFACVASAAEPARPEAHHWSYSGETGPEHWESEDPDFATCGVGKHQSPIDIEKTVVKDLPELKFDYKDVALEVTDTGHSFQVNAAKGSGGFTVGNDHYDFLQVHFHEPSEERVHGEQYSMVAHIVHKNAKGELAVVAVLIRTGKTNEFLKPIFDNFPAKGATKSVVPGKTVNMVKLLPAHHGYYTFDRLSDDAALHGERTLVRAQDSGRGLRSAGERVQGALRAQQPPDPAAERARGRGNEVGLTGLRPAWRLRPHPLGEALIGMACSQALQGPPLGRSLIMSSNIGIALQESENCTGTLGPDLVES